MPTRSLLRRFRLDWPLLGKELMEQAARRQTYILRVTYALLLFGGFCFYYFRHLGDEPVSALGHGLGPFRFLVAAQLLTIYAFLPPLMAGALAQEKERDTLGLLFLTDLTPWELILQKYVGRLIPMMTLLFLSLPLLAVAYSLGGVSITLLCSNAAMLFATCLAVGALALDCSAHQATTFQALVRCWGICIVFATCCSILPLPFLITPTPLPPAVSPMAYILPVLITTVAYGFPTWLFLFRAKHNLERRAFVQRRNPFSHQFRQFDQYWQDLRKLLRAISKSRDPEAREIAEQVVRRQLGVAQTRKASSLGSFLFTRMQVPNLLAVSIIFGFILLLYLTFSTFLDPKSAGFPVVIGGLWILALLTVPIQSANVVARERMNERLGPLLTTPLTGHEILKDWLAPVGRWIQFLMRPMLILILLDALVKDRTVEANNPRWTNLAVYLGLSFLTVWLYPRVAQWACLWIGLKIRNQIRALLAAFFLILMWCLVPVIASGYLNETGILPDDWVPALEFISPVAMIRTIERVGGTQGSVDLAVNLMIPAVIHFGIAAGLVWMVRRACLKNADRYLGRIPIS